MKNTLRLSDICSKLDYDEASNTATNLFYLAYLATCFAAGTSCQSVTEVKNSIANRRIMKNDLVVPPQKGWAVPLVTLAPFQPFVLSASSVAIPQWPLFSTSIYERRPRQKLAKRHGGLWSRLDLWVSFELRSISGKHSVQRRRGKQITIALIKQTVI